MEMRNAHKMLEEKPGRKREHEKCRHRWEVDNKIDIKDIGCEDPVVSSFEHSNELSGSIKGREFLDQLSKYKF
jgi:hypothetical protein